MLFRSISFPFQASAMLYSFIEDNLRIAALTDGQFDFTVGALIKLWDFLADNPEVPAKEKIAKSSSKRRVPASFASSGKKECCHRL